MEKNSLKLQLKLSNENLIYVPQQSDSAELGTLVLVNYRKSEFSRLGFRFQHSKTMKPLTHGTCHYAGADFGSGYNHYNVLPPKGAIVHVPLIFLFVRPSCLSCLSLKMSSKFPSFGSAKKAPLNPKRIVNR